MAPSRKYPHGSHHAKTLVVMAVCWWLRYGLLSSDVEKLLAGRWFVDATYVRVAGVWRYIYWAVDQHGQVIDVLVSKRHNAAAATKFNQ